MNYALDALWWRLRHSGIRDLAAVLTAPALWVNSQELPIAELLGTQGFRLLLAWDDDSNKLPESLPSRNNKRLGKYAEELLAFWLRYAPHCQLLATNLTIQADGRTLGALDFVAEINGRLYHLELACKYYASDNGLPENMCGFDVSDCLLDKAARLDKQLNLSQSEAGQAALRQIGVQPENVYRASIIRGIGFSADKLPEIAPYPPNAWQGKLIHSWGAENIPMEWLDKHFYALTRTEYLAPVRVCAEAVQQFTTICHYPQGLFALVEPRPDGFWHETARIMLKMN